MKTRVIVKHYTKSSEHSKIFDSTSYGERRDIDEGEICNVSDVRALTNINFE